MRAIDLFEVNYKEVYSYYEHIKKYPDKWVHFSNINKLGINPIPKDHDDPHGIYFYPINYLISYSSDSYQYATNFKYYYICDIDLTSNGINLQRLTQQQALDITNQNNWGEGNILPDLINNKYSNDVHDDRPGALFYIALKNLNNNTEYPDKTYSNLLKGFDYMYDPGLGIIGGQKEPRQIIVFNRKIITKLDFGINKSDIFQARFEMIKSLQHEFVGFSYELMKNVVYVQLKTLRNYLNIEFHKLQSYSYNMKVYAVDGSLKPKFIDISSPSLKDEKDRIIKFINEYIRSNRL